MKRSASTGAIPIDRPSAVRHRSNFDLIRSASSKTITRAAIATAVAWLPAAILAAMRGVVPLNSFLTDIATQSRVLVIIPILILAEPALHTQYQQIARQFTKADLISDSDLPRFQANWASFEKYRNSAVARISLVLLVVLTILSFEKYLDADVLMSWTTGGGGWRYLSPAGVWFVWVINTLLFYLFLLWVWRTMLWARFLHATSRLDLRLIPPHPDHAGGLGFVGSYLRKHIPFAFCIGVFVAGGVANRIIHRDQPLLSFKYMPLVVVITVLFLSAAPLCVFMKSLLQAKLRGVFEYGALAIGVGQGFENKWLRRTRPVSEEALQQQDFCATIDLYSIVGNVHQIRMIPIGVYDLYLLLAISLIPAIPVALVAVPFDVLMRQLVRLLF
ncbi:MAG: hypothetical protein JWN45_141 [Acidobacteriaceae bacterium]|nr:hypothetical protein [Acidobacteriaceae bacterium]